MRLKDGQPGDAPRLPLSLHSLIQTVVDSHSLPALASDAAPQSIVGDGGIGDLFEASIVCVVACRLAFWSP